MCFAWDMYDLFKISNAIEYVLYIMTAELFDGIYRQNTSEIFAFCYFCLNSYWLAYEHFKVAL